MTELSPHAKGFLITLIGVLALTTDVLFVKLADMDVWPMTFWRNALMSATLLTVLLLFNRSYFISNIRALGITGFFMGLAMAINSVFFVMALEYASVAKVLITLALIPMISALLSFLFLKEPIKLGTAIACIVSLVGVAIVVNDSLFDQANKTEIWGIIYAFVTAIGVATAFTLTRSKPAVSMVPATALAGLAVSLCILPFISPFELRNDQIFPVLTVGLFVLPVSFGMLAIGPRFIPAPEVGLLMLLETCLGPFWVWLVLDEQPSNTVIFGGTIVVSTLACHAIWSLRQNRHSPKAVH